MGGCRKNKIWPSGVFWIIESVVSDRHGGGTYVHVHVHVDTVWEWLSLIGLNWTSSSGEDITGHTHTHTPTFPSIHSPTTWALSQEYSKNISPTPIANKVALIGNIPLKI